jgi:hypothetical protein
MEKDMSLFESDWFSLLCAALGAALGYWIRSPRGQTPAPPPAVAPELTEALRLVLERHAQKQTQSLLKDLLREAEKSS